MNFVEEKLTEETQKEDLKLAKEESKPVEPVMPKSVINNVKRRGKANRLTNFRKQPSLSSEVIDVLTAGTEVEITGSQSDFYKVTYKNEDGFIKKMNVDEIR